MVVLRRLVIGAILLVYVCSFALGLQSDCDSTLEGECEADLEVQSDDDQMFTVKFENLANGAVSVLWDDGAAFQQVIASIPPRGSNFMNTYNGHRFLFTREGTREPLSDLITMSSEQKTIQLPADAFQKADNGATSSCTDRNPPQCKRDAARGECDKSPGWMIVNCPQSCNSCHLLDLHARCSHKALNLTEEHVWQPGDLNSMFENILEEYKEYEPRVASRPPEGPWVIVFEKFTNAMESDRLIELGGREKGFRRSTDTGAANARGEITKIVSQGRTSENAWCQSGCEDDEIVKSLSARIEAVTKVPQDNYEQFQILRYTKGQYYRTHHDMGRIRDVAGGHRILTFFLYLSDVEEGGETKFPNIVDPETGTRGLMVKPKLGRAVLWPSVHDSDPWKRDDRTMHSAEPVVKGVKYAANHWIHSHNFKKPNLWGCTGAFD